MSNATENGIAGAEKPSDMKPKHRNASKLNLFTKRRKMLRVCFMILMWVDLEICDDSYQVSN